MTRRTAVCCLALLLAVSAAARADVLDEIAPAAVVCVGKEAADEERQAADLTFQALKQRSDSVRLLTDEEVLAAPLAESGKWQLIVVGRPTTNSVLLTYPSYSALDRELHYAPLGNMPAAPFTETRGFYVGGFGYNFAGRNVGFVEFDRSPFYSAMVFGLPDERKRSEKSAPPLCFLIRVTGSSPNGVLLGAKRFVETGMLYGLALGPPRWPRPRDPWNLDDENVNPDPPAWIPRGTYSLRESGKARRRVFYLGWLMADKTMYAGFLEITGCKPVQMWRAKYATEVGMLDFNRSPHHRASGNELLIVKLSSSDDAAKALKNLGGNVPVEISGHICYKTRPPAEKLGDVTAAIEDRDSRRPGTTAPSSTCILPTTIEGAAFLILANFDDDYADLVMAEVIKACSPER